ncbi:cysteine hydrolase [Reyranella sp.]|uniref:cysteine hydrolase n=1 Tax=Reyranella sp. TaxID=1929291 RepID=UPI002731EEEB|nr:cysteine hydrolase [Reyranella sp.]MDP2375386.1 cysteine hydrolase [Reyranella sp.]
MGTPADPFPLDRATVHLCIDMQRLFAEETPWQVPWLPRVLPCVLEIARRHAGRTVFTRFVPPESPADAVGAWRDYYEHWSELTRGRIAPRLLELVDPLAALVPPARVLDKPANSAFSRPTLARGLRARGVTTLVITGGETDVCVLATVTAAVDLGFRIVLPTDALCSTRDGTHDALIKLYRERFSLQIEATTTDDVLRRWND